MHYILSILLVTREDLRECERCWIGLAGYKTRCTSDFSQTAYRKLVLRSVSLSLSLLYSPHVLACYLYTLVLPPAIALCIVLMCIHSKQCWASMGEPSGQFASAASNHH